MTEGWDEIGGLEVISGEFIAEMFEITILSDEILEEVREEVRQAFRKMSSD
jgi:hypothetical protein